MVGCFQCRRLGESDWLRDCQFGSNNHYHFILLMLTLVFLTSSEAIDSFDSCSNQSWLQEYVFQPNRRCIQKCLIKHATTVRRATVSRYNSRSSGCFSQISEPPEPRTCLYLDTGRVLDAVEHIPQGLSKVSNESFRMGRRVEHRTRFRWMKGGLKIYKLLAKIRHGLSVIKGALTLK